MVSTIGRGINNVFTVFYDTSLVVSLLVSNNGHLMLPIPHYFAVVISYKDESTR